MSIRIPFSKISGFKFEVLQHREGKVWAIARYTPASVVTAWRGGAQRSWQIAEASAHLHTKISEKLSKGYKIIASDVFLKEDGSYIGSEADPPERTRTPVYAPELMFAGEAGENFGFGLSNAFPNAPELNVTVKSSNVTCVFLHGEISLRLQRFDDGQIRSKIIADSSVKAVVLMAVARHLGLEITYHDSQGNYMDVHLNKVSSGYPWFTQHDLPAAIDLAEKLGLIVPVVKFTESTFAGSAWL